jgi:peroxiredoxin
MNQMLLRANPFNGDFPWLCKNDLPAFKDDPAWVLPMPARYVIGTDGVIAYSEVNPDDTERPDPSELLPALDRLKASKAA